MKPEELMHSLDYVGNDLLCEAEQTVIARRHRPWVTITAAVLALAVGTGGFFLLRQRLFPARAPQSDGASGVCGSSEQNKGASDGPVTPEQNEKHLLSVVQQENGKCRIVGPSGSVEALNYMGGGCMDPVWADLDADGQQELIYRCWGPTSGLFTVGVCVYGLDEGWPVLKASQIYNMPGGELSLTEQEGQVLLRYTPYRYDAAQGVSLPQAEKILSVTLKNGQVLLNDGVLPEEIQLWGSSNWSLYGSSFSKLKQEVKDRCLFNHWACLVWKDQTDVNNGGRPVIYAAVTSNGSTVTGLLCYLQQEDGTWLFSSWDIEPIEAPTDPSALTGLPMEEMVARYGPCHFDMGSGMYIPCWFTKDRRLLIVHSFDTVEFAELSDLTALGN